MLPISVHKGVSKYPDWVCHWLSAQPLDSQARAYPGRRSGDEETLFLREKFESKSPSVLSGRFRMETGLMILLRLGS
jgi:hypothetical protein